MAQENLYRPVDIGQHIDPNGIKEEALEHAEEIFFLDKDNRGKINAAAYKTFKQIREDWIKREREDYLTRNFATDPLFQVDVDFPIEVIVKEFSSARVRVNIVFTIGHSRWHHYHLLLKDYVIERDEGCDQIFGLKQLEETYAASHKGITHGTSFHQLVRKLGLQFLEYPGQSIQYRTLYYPDDDLEVVLQDGLVKYVTKGKPGWVEDQTPAAFDPDREPLFPYGNFSVIFVPDIGFAAVDSTNNFLFEVFPYDNGPDYPSEGLIRIREEGKVGYADLEGNIVIPPSYECAFPFHNGVAKICEEGILVRDGEHDSWKEARWGAIDREGNTIVEPVDLGMFTFDILEAKLYLHHYFSGKIEATTRWEKPDQLNFIITGEGGGLLVDFLSVPSGKQLVTYLLLPWQDLYMPVSAGHDAKIPTEQLVTVTQKYIVYLVSLAPVLSDEEADDIMELSDMVHRILGYEETQQLIREANGITAFEGLQVISLKEYPYYLELSVATPGIGVLSPDAVRLNLPRKMILLHQVPDIGAVRTNWIKPGPPEDYTATPEASPEELSTRDELFPDYEPKRTPDTMLDYMPSLLADLADIPSGAPSNLPNLIHLYKKYRELANQHPGQWVYGNIVLGAREKEYQPSAGELILMEIGERIGTLISETDPQALADILEDVDQCPEKVEFTRFFFIHYDVMGSGRFFYIDGMEHVTLDIK